MGRRRGKSRTATGLAGVRRHATFVAVSARAKNLSAGGERSRNGWAIVVIALVTVAVLSPIVGNSFLHWDDQLNLTENPDFTPVTVAGVMKYWRKPYLDLYIPVTYTAWGLLAAVGGGEPDARVFHAANLLVHAGAAVAVFVLLRRLRASAWAAAIGAMLFALHPLQVEAVAWASGLKDVLSGALCLWALVAYVRAAEGARPARAYAVATVLFVLAMLAKPQAVCLPVVAGAIDLLLVGRPVKRVATAVVPWLVLAVPIIVIGRVSQAPVKDVPHAPVPVRVLTAADDLAFYAGKVIAPVRLTIDYGRTTNYLMHSSQRYVTWAVPVALAIAAVVLRRRAPWFAAGLAVFAAALVPVLGFVPFDYQAYSNVADHYVYVAMLGAAIIGCFTFAKVERWPRARGVAAAVLVLCAIGSVWQTRYWRDDAAVFGRALEVTPDSVAGNVNNVNVGIERMHEGRLEDAERLFDSALRVSPGHPGALINLASLRAAQGRVDESIERFRAVLKDHPDNAEAHFDFGNVLWQKAGRPAEAIEQYRAAIAINPKAADFHANLGLALMQSGDAAQGMAEVRRALELKPANATLWTVLGNAQAERGDIAAALESFKSALRADPGFEPARQGVAQAERFLNR